MNELSNLRPAPGSTHRRKRVGRGESSGRGKTAGAGGKGQTARSGNSKPGPGFEGGQMPLARRLPKRGFVSKNRVEYVTVNVGSLEGFPAGTVVDLAGLRSRGLVKKAGALLKVLGDGEIPVALTVRAHKFSRAAVDKLTAAGGAVEILPV